MNQDFGRTALDIQSTFKKNLLHSKLDATLEDKLFKKN